MGEERWREKRRKTVIKRRCLNPFSGDVIEGFGPMDESGSLEDSCGDF